MNGMHHICDIAWKSWLQDKTNDLYCGRGGHLDVAKNSEKDLQQAILLKITYFFYGGEGETIVLVVVGHCCR
jgi:hypothetical protein